MWYFLTSTGSNLYWTDPYCPLIEKGLWAYPPFLCPPLISIFCSTFQKGDGICILFRTEAVGLKTKTNYSYDIVTILILVFYRERGHDSISFVEAPQSYGPFSRECADGISFWLSTVCLKQWHMWLWIWTAFLSNSLLSLRLTLVFLFNTKIWN